MLCSGLATNKHFGQHINVVEYISQHVLQQLKIPSNGNANYCRVPISVHVANNVPGVASYKLLGPTKVRYWSAGHEHVVQPRGDLSNSCRIHGERGA